MASTCLEFKHHPHPPKLCYQHTHTFTTHTHTHTYLYVLRGSVLLQTKLLQYLLCAPTLTAPRRPRQLLNVNVSLSSAASCTLHGQTSTFISIISATLGVSSFAHISPHHLLELQGFGNDETALNVVFHSQVGSPCGAEIRCHSSECNCFPCVFVRVLTPVC